MPRSILSQARRSQPRCRTPIPTISSAPMSRGSKTISASRSTSRRSPKSSAALRPIPATPATTDPMQIEPSETAFAERYGRGQAQVVWTTLIAESRIELPESLPPMAAGVFGYLGYDMVRLMEELPPPNPDPIGIPDAVLVRPTIVVVFDAVKDSITVVTPVRPEKGVDAKTALARAVERLSRILESLDRPLDKSLSDYDEGPVSYTHLRAHE